MNKIAIVLLICLASCGLPSHKPVVGVYDLTTNDVTRDTCSGYADDMASPMSIDIKQTESGYSLYVCGAVGADCSQEQLYATSNDGYHFTIAALFTGSFTVSYNTDASDRTTISGTGTTTGSFLGATCTWYTVFDGTKR